MGTRTTALGPTAAYLSGSKTFPIPMFVVPGRDASAPGASDVYNGAAVVEATEGPAGAGAPGTPGPAVAASDPAAPEGEGGAGIAIEGTTATATATGPAPAPAPAPTRRTLCHNVEVLARSGVRVIAGVTVAWLSGTFDSASFSNAPDPANWAHYVSADVQTLVGATKDPGYRGVDIFLSSEWPQK
jgi:hypothetical protein